MRGGKTAPRLKWLSNAQGQSDGGIKYTKEIFPKYNGDNFMLILVTIFSLSHTRVETIFYPIANIALVTPHPQNQEQHLLSHNDWVTLSYLFFSWYCQRMLREKYFYIFTARKRTQQQKVFQHNTNASREKKIRRKNSLSSVMCHVRHATLWATWKCFMKEKINLIKKQKVKINKWKFARSLFFLNLFKAMIEKLKIQNIFLIL